MALNYNDDRIWYVEAERRVVEKHFGGLMVTKQVLY